jgi:hypothetical protein
MLERNFWLEGDKHVVYQKTFFVPQEDLIKRVISSLMSLAEKKSQGVSLKNY